ncbi:hypothetical protein [uncultured Sphingomonas sp.]
MSDQDDDHAIGDPDFIIPRAMAGAWCRPALIPPIRRGEAL